ncbi:FAD-binding oxidoreductase [Micromonospora auratinigra]|uniref:FAD/FMN-containing dehydrogenase n=1 Tax=Micromonospora auratinigra TaxID=261654 RepID=A0A1A8ZKV5_9ACTN|nr:FAD-binding oxidoreductase [Micromonospora auratinigra]SBT44502.1 FAD/FMN-containing dehydrogenase [Micromonospora auratinigra]
MTSVPDLPRATELLRAALGDRLLTPSDAGFAAAVRLWNGAPAATPALVAHVADADEVALAVRVAARCGVPFSVRAGGHDWAGRALRAGGLVVDLTALRRVDVDPDARTVTVGGGVTAADVLAALRPYDQVVATGVVRAVGLAGLTLAGGYGPLCGRVGLALDNLLGAEVVLADGRQVTADAAHEPELYWALRGGGGNFGVVTALRYRTHRLSAALAGMLMFPLEQAVPVLRGYGAVLRDAPDELTVMAGFLGGPAGEPVVFLAPFHTGDDPDAGRPAVDRLRALGTPLVDQVAPLPYEDALRLFDGGMADGNHYFLRTRWLEGPGEAVVAALVAAARTVTSPYSAIALHHFHGAASRVPVGDTAFGRRDDHLLAEVIAAWAPGDDPTPHRAWAEHVSRALAPHALPGGYPNLLDPAETDRVRLAYGPNWDRLVRAKRRYDPHGRLSAVPTLPDVTPPSPRVAPDRDGAEPAPADRRERPVGG